MFTRGAGYLQILLQIRSGDHPGCRVFPDLTADEVNKLEIIHWCWISTEFTTNFSSCEALKFAYLIMLLGESIQQFHVNTNL